MAQDRTLLIPWNEHELGVFVKGGVYKGLDDDVDELGYAATLNNMSRKKQHHERKWAVVYLDTPDTPLKKVGVGVGTRVHVTGHGSPNSDLIKPPYGSTLVPVSAAQVAAALAAQGLKKRYIGTIVCDVCNSATGKTPFAKSLSRELWTLGYKGTCVMGYTGVLQDAYGQNPESKTLTGKYTHRAVKKSDGTVVKSSAAQIRFFGFA